MPPSTTPPRRLALLGLLAAAVAATAAPDADAASRLLWTDVTNGTISSAALDGSGIVPAFIGSASSPSAVVVRGRHVYWTNGNAGSIGRASIDGTGVNQTFLTGLGAVLGLAVSGSHVYWTVPISNRIGRANLDGTAPTPTFMTASSGLSLPAGLALDASHLYWSNASGNSIGRANLDGTGADGNFISAGAPSDGSFALAVDDSHIYWTNDDTDAISRANLDGSQVDLSFVPAGTTMRGLAVGGGGIFWGDNAGGAIGRADVDGSDADPALISPLTDVGGVGLAIDGAGFSPGAADFGAIPVDADPSPAADLTLRNTGNTTLDLDAVQVAGAQASSFSVVADGCGGRPLEVAAGCVVRVAFRPTAEGPASATLSVGGTALSAPATAALSGAGVADLIPPPASSPSPLTSPPPAPLGRLSIRPAALQRRDRLARAVATVRVPGRGVVSGEGRATVGRRSFRIPVRSATARSAGPVRLSLGLPRAVRAEIARRGRATARLRLDLTRGDEDVARGDGRVRIAAPASRAMPRQWLGRRLGPWRTPPRFGARDRAAIRLVRRGSTWSAVVVR